MKNKPEAGQTLYRLNVGNAARRSKQKLTEVIVLSVGRKYFTCCEEGYEQSKHWHTQYYLDNWHEKSNYCANSRLYESPQEWEDEKESLRLFLEIKKVFDYSHNGRNLTLAALREIHRLAHDNQIVEK